MKDFSETGIERHLREMFRGEEPPAALTERLLAHARGAQPRRACRARRLLAALAAVLLAASAGTVLGVTHYRQAQALRAREAQARLLYALQITTGELNWAEVTVHRDMAAGAGGADR